MENYIQIIKQYFSKVKLWSSSCRLFLQNNPQIDKKLTTILAQIPQYSKKFNIIKYIVNDQILQKCQRCGNYLTVFQSDGVKANKSYRFCMQCNKLPQVRKIIRLRALPKFKATMKARYGVQFSAQSKEINEKRKQTCIKKYGSQYAISSKEVITKITNTHKRKYGVNNHMKLSKRQLYYRMQKYIIPLFSLEQFLQDRNLDGIVRKWQCVKCGNIFQKHLHKTMHISEIPYLPRCLNCYPYSEGTSNVQKQLIKFCRQYFPELQQNNRQLIKPYQVDILIPQIKLAIQFNGTYWHDINHVQSSYHLMKTQMCQKLGYRLIHIWQDQWYNDEQLIKNKLISIFQNRQVINLNQPLDRCWYSNIDIEGYNKQMIQPSMVWRNGYQCYNCGYIIYRKK